MKSILFLKLSTDAAGLLFKSFYPSATKLIEIIYDKSRAEKFTRITNVKTMARQNKTKIHVAVIERRRTYLI